MVDFESDVADAAVGVVARKKLIEATMDDDDAENAHAAVDERMKIGIEAVRDDDDVGDALAVGKEYWHCQICKKRLIILVVAAPHVQCVNCFVCDLSYPR